MPDAATPDMTREMVIVCSSGKSNDPKAALPLPHHSHGEQVTQKCPSLEDVLQGQKEGLVALPEGKAKGMDKVETELKGLKLGQGFQQWAPGWKPRFPHPVSKAILKKGRQDPENSTGIQRPGLPFTAKSGECTFAPLHQCFRGEHTGAGGIGKTDQWPPKRLRDVRDWARDFRF